MSRFVAADCICVVFCNEGLCTNIIRFLDRRDMIRLKCCTQATNFMLDQSNYFWRCVYECTYGPVKRKFTNFKVRFAKLRRNGILKLQQTDKDKLKVRHNALEEAIRDYELDIARARRKIVSRIGLIDLATDELEQTSRVISSMEKGEDYVSSMFSWLDPPTSVGRGD
jgi:hypothetical protein